MVLCTIVLLFTYALYTYMYIYTTYSVYILLAATGYILHGATNRVVHTCTYMLHVPFTLLTVPYSSIPYWPIMVHIHDICQISRIYVHIYHTYGIYIRYPGRYRTCSPDGQIPRYPGYPVSGTHRGRYRIQSPDG